MDSFVQTSGRGHPWLLGNMNYHGLYHRIYYNSPIMDYSWNVLYHELSMDFWSCFLFFCGFPWVFHIDQEIRPNSPNHQWTVSGMSIVYKTGNTQRESTAMLRGPESHNTLKQLGLIAPNLWICLCLSQNIGNPSQPSWFAFLGVSINGGTSKWMVYSGKTYENG